MPGIGYVNILLGYLIIILSSVQGAWAAPSSVSAITLRKWEVGQYVEYQILHPENEGGKNLYRISLVGKEMINGMEYFWEKIEIFECIHYIRGEFLRKNITVMALVLPVTSDEYSSNSFSIIQNGFFPRNALKLHIQFYDQPFVEVDPAIFTSNQSIIENTPYSMSPDAKGQIDLGRMESTPQPDVVTVPAGRFECDHVFVRTDEQRGYHDEGFDLWRSSQVPLLGIVRMEFSKTLYWKKWLYRNRPPRAASVEEFIKSFFNQRVLGRDRDDSYTIILVNYGLLPSQR